MDPKELLEKLRGTEEMCGCGKKLVPSFYKGKRTGLTHEDFEDDEHHMNFWAGLKVEIIND